MSFGILGWLPTGTWGNLISLEVVIEDSRIEELAAPS
jgi:hypothetical protein